MNYDAVFESFDDMNLKEELLRGDYAYGFEGGLCRSLGGQDGLGFRRRLIRKGSRHLSGCLPTIHASRMNTTLWTVDGTDDGRDG